MWNIWNSEAFLEKHCWDLHINTSQYYQVTVPSLVWFKWIQLDHFLTMDKAKPTNVRTVYFIQSHTFLMKARTVIWGCTPEPTYSKVKSWLTFESLFQELPSAFLEWANRKGKATPWLQYSTAAFRIEDHFQGICSSLREPLWDTLISYGVMRCKSTRYYSDPQMNLATRTRNPDSSGQRGRQVLNPLRSNCYLLPHK